MSGIPRPGRCTAEEKRRRVAELQAAVAAGESPLPAVKRLAKTWGITSRRNASRYVDACAASWEREASIGRRARLAVAVARRELVYRLALAGDDLVAANRALDALDLLHGIADARAEVETLINGAREALVELIPDRGQRARVSAALRDLATGTASAASGGDQVSRNGRKLAS